jgi:hypothetical protein
MDYPCYECGCMMETVEYYEETFNKKIECPKCGATDIVSLLD